MAKYRHYVGDKYVQTRLDSYFKVTGEILFTRVKDNSKMKQRARRKICGSEKKMEHNNVDISVIVEKRRLPEEISSSEDEDSERNNKVKFKQNKKSFGPVDTSTPTTSRHANHLSNPTPSTSGIKRKSTPEIKSSGSPQKVAKNPPIVDTNLNQSNELINPSSSTSVIKKRPVSKVQNFESPGNISKSTLSLDKNINKSRNVTVLDNVVVSSAKPEEKKVNYTTVRVMKEFFLNILGANHLKYLLSSSEREMLYTLFNSDKYYQYTCIKLFMWKRQFYNIFRYINQIDLEMAEHEVISLYNFLKENEFVDTDYFKEDLHTFLNLLTLKDLREIQRSFKFRHPCTTRNEIIAKLIQHCKQQGTLTCKKSTEEILRDRTKQKLGYCVKLSDKPANALNYVYILNTFTNPNLLKIQDFFKNFNIVYPPYEVESLQIFGRDEFVKFAEALELKKHLEIAIENRKTANILQICRVAFSTLQNISSNYEERNLCMLQGIQHLERFTAHYQYVTIISKGMDFVKSSHYKEVKTWLELLISQKSCRHKRGYWFCMLASIYTNYLKEYVEAAELIISTFKNEEHLSEVQLHELAAKGRILNRKTYNLPALFHDQIAELSPPTCDRLWPAAYVESRTMRDNQPGQKRTYVQDMANGDRNYLTVEQVALEHYRKSGFPHGLHCEGSVVCAIFSLLFWDIIYGAEVKGAFISNMQNAPLDMFTKYFYLNRRVLIEERLNCIKIAWEDEALRCFLLHQWDQHSHEASLCAIDSVVSSGGQLYQIIECMGRFVLTKILERLVKNYRVFHSGFPDLIVWNHAAKKCKFVEVKGENDKLSIKQKLWMGYLMAIGASVELCNVHSTGSKKKNVKKNKDAA